MVWTRRRRSIRQLLRKSLAERSANEARINERGRDYDVRVTAQGPDRAIVAIRAVLQTATEDPADVTGERRSPALDRRGFLKRFRESLSVATLREKSLAVAVLYLDGIPEISQVIATRISEQVMTTAVLRLAALANQNTGSEPQWYLGQLSENILAVVLDTSEREQIEATVGEICASLREPIAAGHAEFRVTPYAGIGVLGLDATSPKVLLDHARAAAAEARRSASAAVFFTATRSNCVRSPGSTSRASCAKAWRTVTSAFATSAGTTSSPGSSSRGSAICAGCIRCAEISGPRNFYASLRAPALQWRSRARH